jgi:hypothetical protein
MATRLGVRGTQFTHDGRPLFLLGISYYGGLGAAEAVRDRDLEEMRRHGFHWLRVWSTWSAFDRNVSAVDGEGRPHEPFLGRLRDLVAACDRRGMVVDVTLSRGNSITGPARLQSLATHLRAVETLLTALASYRNWYLDLGNERNIRDARFVSVDDLRTLRDAVKKRDPERLVTASHAGDISANELQEYLLTVQVDLLCPHRPRHAGSPAETEAKSKEYRARMQETGRVVPLHYQEPFRRGFGAWEPRAEDFLIDLRGAQAGGAAGWCFHNGSTRDAREDRPRRSFDLREQGLFAQLDAEECRFLDRLPAEIKKPDSATR